MKRVPVATYRLQLTPQLTFDDVARHLDYLGALGISDCYLSPIFETATPGSHGYDVNDPARLRAELGGDAAFTRLATALGARGMGLLLDVVPNHMGIAHNRNAWWLDVLENGAASPFASYFDIDWRPVKRELADKVLLPILGDQYGTALEAGQLRLELDAGAGRFLVRYYETVLPIAPQSYGGLLSHRIERLEQTLSAEHPQLLELKSLITWFATLPPPTERDRDRLAARRREQAIGHERLRALLAASAEVRTFVEDNVRLFNGTPGESRSFDLLDALLADQAYRVAFWRVAGEEINYRRFFDINELAAIRVEQPEVFAATHALVFRLVGEGVITGLRVDHPDGLYDPAAYFARLQRGCGGDFYIAVEKILAPGEPLRETWATDGTTGYEFLNLVNGIFVDRSQARAMDLVYRRFVQEAPSFDELVAECKRLIMETSMASELNVLAHRLNTISEKHRSSRDFTLGSLTTALRETVAAFPIYRTYVGDSGDVTAVDREYMTRAIAQRPDGARRR